MDIPGVVVVEGEEEEEGVGVVVEVVAVEAAAVGEVEVVGSVFEPYYDDNYLDQLKERKR